MLVGTCRLEIFMKDSLPPLLRGIGTAVMLTATVIAFYIAHQDDQSPRTLASPTQIISEKAGGDALAALASEIQELREEVAEDDVVEKVLENVWFECLGFAGTAIFAASFFVEAYVRRSKT